MLRPDSIESQPAAPAADTAAGAAEHTLRPYEVLRALPQGATPAQQDSAIQAVFHPKPVRYSSQPDTLHLPGHGPGKSPRDVSLPEYYREGFFSRDTLFHPELDGGRYGVAGDPVPQTMRADNVVTIVLLACFIIAITAISRSRRFIARQAKNFFYAPRGDGANLTETSGEVRFQAFLVLQTCLLFSLLQYSYTINYIGTTFVLDSPYQLMAIYLGFFVACFIVRGLLYTAVNATFFGMRRHLLWLKSLLFITSVEGVMLFPVVLLMVYFDLSPRSVTYCVLFILIIVKILTFYKCYIIFFKRFNGFLQIILYFCALEIAPLATLWGALVITGNYLKINL